MCAKSWFNLYKKIHNEVNSNIPHYIFHFFYLAGQELSVVNKVKYLGHIIRSHLCDNDDIQRQYCKLYAQGNMLAHKFSMCTDDVKIDLFKAHCTPLYTAYLWCSYSKAKLNKLQVAYNDALWLLLKVLRWTSASQFFVQNHVPMLCAVIRNFVYKFIKRLEVKILEVSKNEIIVILEKSTVRYTSALWRHWRKCLLAVKMYIIYIRCK